MELKHIIGIVEDIEKDPLMMFRARVRLIEKHGKDVPVDHLPWSTVMVPIGGNPIAPTLNSIVLCLATDEHYEQLIIVGELPGLVDEKTSPVPFEAAPDTSPTPGIPPSVQTKAENMATGINVQIALSGAAGVMEAFADAQALMQEAIAISQNPLGFIIDKLPVDDMLSSVVGDETKTAIIDTAASGGITLTPTEVNSVLDASMTAPDPSNPEVPGLSPEKIQAVTGPMQEVGGAIQQLAAGDFTSFMSAPGKIAGMLKKKLSSSIPPVEKNPIIDGTYKAAYPTNNAIKTKGGHIIEIDDTAGGERIHLFHKSGSYMEIIPDGTVLVKSIGDMQLIASNNLEIMSQGDMKINAVGNLEIAAGGIMKIAAFSLYTQASFGKIAGLYCPFGRLDHDIIPKPPEPTIVG